MINSFIPSPPSISCDWCNPTGSRSCLLNSCTDTVLRSQPRGPAINNDTTCELSIHERGTKRKQTETKPGLHLCRTRRATSPRQYSARSEIPTTYITRTFPLSRHTVPDYRLRQKKKRQDSEEKTRKTQKESTQDQTTDREEKARKRARPG